jgi:hypothetical protein
MGGAQRMMGALEGHLKTLRAPRMALRDVGKEIFFLK